MEGDPGSATSTRDTQDVGVPLDWLAMWRGLANVLRDHVLRGRRHLLTEDVVRFATVVVLGDQGVTANRLSAERTVMGVGRVDLLIDGPSGTAVEFKFPREPSEKNAADTMAFGHTLRDFDRLARLDVADAWAVLLLRPAFFGFLHRRTDVRWTAVPGEVLVLPADLPASLPVSARGPLRGWAGNEVRARCELLESLGDDRLVVYRIERGRPRRTDG